MWNVSLSHSIAYAISSIEKTPSFDIKNKGCINSKTKIFFKKILLIKQHLTIYKEK